MKTTINIAEPAPRKVEQVFLPVAAYGFRTGYARATVDGVRLSLYTSRHASTDPDQHRRDVADQFARGEGFPEVR